MLDSDQSYLLRSYNENQQLFANTPHLFNPSKTQQSNRKDLSGGMNGKQFKLKQNRKRSHSLYDNNGEGQIQENVGGLDLNVKMMDSIWQDCREQERTASKIKLTGKKVRFLDDQHQNQRQTSDNNGYWTTKLQTRSRKSSDVNEKSISSFNGLNFGKNSIKQFKDDKSSSIGEIISRDQINLEQQEIVSFEKQFLKMRKDSQFKIQSLSQFLTQLFKKYIELSRRLQSYQKLVEDLEQLVSYQQKYINTCTKQFELINKKVEKLVQVQQPLSSFGSTYVQFKESIKVVKQKISYLIHDKFSSQLVQNGIQTLQEKGKNTHNYVHNAINYTKSVPLFTPLLPQNQNNKHFIDRIDEVKPFEWSKSKQAKEQNSNKGMRTDLSAGKELSSKEQCFNHEDGGEIFRKLANFRIKQLQTQHMNLTNEINSKNAKLMVIKNENKQLREIVEALISQIQNLQKNNRYQF